MKGPALELADIFHLHGRAHCETFGDSLSADQRKALRDNPGLPHRSPRRPHQAMRSLRPSRVRLSFLSQSQSPEVPGRSQGGVA